ncbi:MAG: DUF1097 domain-containing protein [Johnsonella sp.]|nr:DUF1097 domain-containing protein [Johnsonella sp.]
MMKVLKHTPIALFVGIQAGMIQMIDQMLHSHMPISGGVGYSWASFLGWATYFMPGCTVFNGIQSVVSFVMGIISGIFIFTIAGAIGSMGFWAAPAAVCLIAWLLMYLELCPKLFRLIPAVYVACAAFFGSMLYIPGATYPEVFITLMVYLLLGLVLGWMTITFRTWYSKKIGEEESSGH